MVYLAPGAELAVGALEGGKKVASMVENYNASRKAGKSAKESEEHTAEDTSAPHKDIEATEGFDGAASGVSSVVVAPHDGENAKDLNRKPSKHWYLSRGSRNDQRKGQPHEPNTVHSGAEPNSILSALFF